MKELKRTIEQVYGYESNDGIFFSKEEECKKYEESAKGIVSAMFNALKTNTINGECLYDLMESGSDFTYIGIVPQSASDLEVINRQLYLNNWSQTVLSTTYIGKQCVFGRNYDNEVWFCGTVDELRERFEKILTKLFQKPESK